MFFILFRSLFLRCTNVPFYLLLSEFVLESIEKLIENGSVEED